MYLPTSFFTEFSIDLRNVNRWSAPLPAPVPLFSAVQTESEVAERKFKEALIPFDPSVLLGFIGSAFPHIRKSLQPHGNTSNGHKAMHQKPQNSNLGLAGLLHDALKRTMVPSTLLGRFRYPDAHSPYAASLCLPSYQMLPGVFRNERQYERSFPTSCPLSWWIEEYTGRMFGRKSSELHGERIIQNLLKASPSRSISLTAKKVA